MRWLDRIAMRFETLVRRRRASVRLADELEFHLEQQLAENMEAGMGAEEARRAALRHFGNPSLVREQTRATWSWGPLDALIQDARFGARSLGRKPGFVATVVGTMALGIGAAAAMFTVVDHVLIRPVSFRDAARLVTISEGDRTGKDVWSVPWLDGQAWIESARSFAGIALVRQMAGHTYLEGGTASFEVRGSQVSANLFSVLGVRPALGRGFEAGSPDSPHQPGEGTVVLSHAAWIEGFNADPNILGKALRINNAAYTVVGVMPASFRFPVDANEAPQVWSGLELTEADRSRSYEGLNFTAVARLAKGATLASAESEMALLQERIAQQYTDPDMRKDHAVVRLWLLNQNLVNADVRTALLALLSAAAVLWLIASLNVTNLLLARNMARRRETAVRVALGSSRFRIVRQMLLEGLALNLSAALLGAALAIASVRMLAHELNQLLPLPASATPDPWILLALLGLTLASTVISTTGPAWLAVHAPVEPALKQGGAQTGTSRRQNRLRTAMVAAEIALSLCLLATCGLLLRTIYILRHVALGYRTDHIVVASLGIPAFRYEGQNVTSALYMPLLERVRHLPGVASAGLTSQVPLNHTFVITLSLKTDGKPVVGTLKPVSPEIQQIFGFKMLAGRFFTNTDTPDSQAVAVVNPAFARLFAPDRQDPKSIVGTKFWSFRKGHETHIIGILDDQRQTAVTKDSQPEVDVCLCQITRDSGIYQPATVSMDLALRTERSPSDFIPELRAVLRQASPELASARIETMDQIAEDSYGSQRLAAHLLEIFGVSALVLCMGGLYGLLAYLVSQRTRELGLRVALGARRVDLIWMVIRQAAVMLGAGVLGGIGLSLAAGRLVSRFLYGVSDHDLTIMLAAPAFLVATGLLAAYLPARRAAGVNPMEALRAE